MVCRLVDLAVVVLKLVLFNVCGIIGISKITLFSFSDCESVRKNAKIKKKHSKPPNFLSQSLFKPFQKLTNSFSTYH